MIDDTSMLASSGLPLTKRRQSGTHAGCRGTAAVTVLPAPKGGKQVNKACFVAAIQDNGELLTRVSFQTDNDKLMLLTLIRTSLYQLEEELTAKIQRPKVSNEGHVSSSLKAA